MTAPSQPDLKEPVPLAEATLALLKANEAAEAWIKEAVANAKFHGTDIDVIPNDKGGRFWTRTNRVRRQLREARQKAIAAVLAKENDR